MSNDFTWTQERIQKVNNLLLIMGDQILKSGQSQERVYKACYALPSDPDKMNAWCNEWINDESCHKFIDLIL